MSCGLKVFGLNNRKSGLVLNILSCCLKTFLALKDFVLVFKSLVFWLLNALSYPLKVLPLRTLVLASSCHCKVLSRRLTVSS